MTPVDVWVRMAEMYGERWTSLMGDVPNEMWTAAIVSMKPYQAQHAFKLLIEEGGEHPPSLPKFVRFAKAADPSSYEPAKLTDPTENQSIHQRYANRRIFDIICKQKGLEQQLLDKVVAEATAIAREAEQKEADGVEYKQVVREFATAFDERVYPLL